MAKRRIGQEVISLRKLLPMILTACMAACASDGAPPARSPPPPHTVDSTDVPTNMTTAAEPEEVSAGDAAQGSGFVPPAGFRKKKFRGKTVYCKSEAPLGTRFERRYCYTEEQLERIEANRQNVQREVNRARHGCVAAGNYCGGG
jgi:hypothetical protein